MQEKDLFYIYEKFKHLEKYNEELTVNLSSTNKHLEEALTLLRGLNQEVDYLKIEMKLLKEVKYNKNT